jgi:hypothetical protein
MEKRNSNSSVVQPVASHYTECATTAPHYSYRWLSLSAFSLSIFVYLQFHFSAMRNISVLWPWWRLLYVPSEFCMQLFNSDYNSGLLMSLHTPSLPYSVFVQHTSHFIDLYIYIYIYIYICSDFQACNPHMWQQSPVQWCEILCSHSGKFQDKVLWNVILCCLVHWYLNFRGTYPEDGGNRFLENFGTKLYGITAENSNLYNYNIHLLLLHPDMGLSFHYCRYFLL